MGTVARHIQKRRRTTATVVIILLLGTVLGLESHHATRDDFSGLEEFMTAEARSLTKVVAHVVLDHFSGSESPDQLEHIIDALMATPHLRFLVLDGPGTMRMATTGAEILLEAAPADFLQPVGPEIVTEFLSPVGPVFAFTRRLDLPDGGSTRILVGLDASPLVEMRQDNIMRQRLHLALVMVVIILVVALLLAQQRQANLDRKITDVSLRLQRRESEARRQEKLVAMGALAAGVGHQLRNPLNSIQLLSQMLCTDPTLTSPIARTVDQIRGEVARIDASITQFLEFARPRDPLLQRFDLAVLVREVADLQNTAHTDRGVEITGYAPSSLFVEADRGFVVEILENLLRNALEAGALRVMASLVQERGMAVVAVADDGPGVPEGEREHIFDLYYTTRPDGTGLGLSLANQMAAALGGKLALADTPGLSGRGARFTLELPRRRSTS